MPAFPTSLRLSGLAQVAANGLGNHMAMLGQVFEHADDFDIIHCHLDYWTFAFSKLVETPTITTLHGRLDLEELVPIFKQFKDRPLISISDSQRKPLPWANWVSTVHHGVPREHLQFNPKGGNTSPSWGALLPRSGPTSRLRSRARPAFL